MELTQRFVYLFVYFHDFWKETRHFLRSSYFYLLLLISCRKSHTADPLHKCNFCNKTFTNMTKYLYHRRIHLNRDTSGASIPVPAVVKSANHLPIVSTNFQVKTTFQSDACLLSSLGLGSETSVCLCSCHPTKSKNEEVFPQ